MYWASRYIVNRFTQRVGKEKYYAIKEFILYLISYVKH